MVDVLAEVPAEHGRHGQVGVHKSYGLVAKSLRAFQPVSIICLSFLGRSLEISNFLQH